VVGTEVGSDHTTASSKAKEKVMTGQAIKNNMQFRILACSDTGDSLPSNTVEEKL